MVAAFVLLWSWIQVAGASDYEVTDIRVTGNEKTRPEALLRELSFSAGMTVSASEIEEGRRSIMALGLFSVVETQLHPTEKGHRLWIHVQEKHFFLPMPIVNLSGDGDWTYGIVSQTDNLLGLNQQLKVTFRHKIYNNADIEQEKRLQIRYQAPRITNSPFGIELGLNNERAFLNEARQALAGRYERRLISGRVIMSRWLRPAGGPSSGWRMSLGLQHQAYEHLLLSGDADLLFDAGVFTILARLENEMVTVLADRRTGQHYGYELQKITPTVGRSVNEHFGFYRSYQNLGFGTAAQLHTNFRIGACSGSVFSNPCFSLGGATTIRGVRRNSLEGNMFVLANLQLLAPMAGAKYIRGVVFLDVATAADSMSTAMLLRPTAGVGVGLVWKLRRFVKTDVRIELAHSPGIKGGNRVYAATSMLF